MDKIRTQKIITIPQTPITEESFKKWGIKKIKEFDEIFKLISDNDIYLDIELFRNLFISDFSLKIFGTNGYITVYHQ